MKDDKIKQLDYLEEERKKIWNRLISLESEIKKRTPDYEAEAKQSSKRASEFKNKTEETKIVAEKSLNSILKIKTDSENIFDELQKVKSEILIVSEESSVNDTQIKATYEELQKKQLKIEKQISDLEEIFESENIYIEKINKLEQIFTDGDEYSSKIETVYKALLYRKTEIDKLYFDIIGSTEEDKVTGEITIIEGKKDELEKSYSKVKSDLELLAKKLNELDTNTNQKYKNFLDEKEQFYTKRVTSWEKQFNTVNTKIERLLPNALTAGLSYAFSEKKDAESKERRSHSFTFNVAIIGLIIVSLIPFAFSIKSIWDGVDLKEVILDMPRLVLSILPLYIPVLWVAYSSNRKMNLSKRLIEEYSHKEVLSKTFEGLSTQINSLSEEDYEASVELRIKLLYNILEVSSENPGKLISDYNKADHPLMDALDKSVKLSNAVTRLSNIPGISKLTEFIDKKSKDLIDDGAKKVEDGIKQITK